MRVYNPDFEQHGWQSPHTVVEIVTDDMPFLVDSVTMELSRQGYGDRPGDPPGDPRPPRRRTVALDGGPRARRAERRRDPPSRSSTSRSTARPTRARSTSCAESIERVLGDVRAAVEDWQAMRAARRGSDRRARRGSRRRVDPDERRGGAARSSRGSRTTTSRSSATASTTSSTRTARRGCSARRRLGPRHPARRPPSAGVREAAGRRRASSRASAHPLVLTKANSRATVHRPAYLDYIGVKRFDADGEVDRRAPLPRPLHDRRLQARARARSRCCARKVAGACSTAPAFPPGSHDDKALVEILETYPRDELFQIDGDELFDDRDGHPRARRAPARAAVRAPRPVRPLRLVPRLRPARPLQHREPRAGRRDPASRRSAASHVDWTLQLSESVLVRVHFIVCTPGRRARPTTTSPRSRRGSSRPTRAWTDDLRDALIDEHGEERGDDAATARYERRVPGRLPRRLAGPLRASPTSTASRSSPAATALDLEPLPAARGAGRACCAASCSAPGGVSLSDVLPMLEHMGVKVVDERPYEITPARRRAGVDLRLRAAALRGAESTSTRVRDVFQDAFVARLARRASRTTASTGWCSRAGLTGREITIAARGRASTCARPGIAFSDALHRADAARPPRHRARCSSSCSSARFDPDARATTPSAERLQRRDRGGDRRGRRASTRTGSCAASWRVVQRDAAHQLLPASTPTARRSRTCRSSSTRARCPVPAAAAAAVRDLRATRRASRACTCAAARSRAAACAGRTGREDFRTEVLGPDEGADGQERGDRAGRRQGRLRASSAPPADGGREALLEEGVACYRTFLRGLLDLTDNIVGGEIVPPPRVVRHDDDDPYLVVAADKGTATFSDIANGVAAEYGFWLGDAFASGGSAGYDHKEMGITARGAWESVKRHFRELGHRHRRRPTSPSSASATCRATCSATACCCRAHIRLRRRVRPPPHLPRSRTRTRRRASPSASGCSSCRARRGPTTTRR